MNPHRSGMDYLLGIDQQSDEMKLVLTKALTALRLSKPINGRSAEQIRAARKDITAVLRRAA
ncbi:hypothetical protein UFOVP1157_24 [uncultured Caudovirales phage]|uniref:Uncharacterized protein n=1 Tax=uncultured Caudovirales phage TaxID=2100421 RepID=A0A6J5MIB3_9CAUD|nr:hypothetical protein UFOVP497_11 [uncultured Caudovirales phage]CAB4164591.1 hypothetical protein UFOVP834_47 [uncultured Caudovirales phage]CAB4172367.1 hypothetical protein UFOVP922_24 [uncultured Caudovirales phage]CAB4177589.1 hypothetical protein UFOVP1006_17 [uncultured Caudovirales phage]CAB4183702.1 hypothetical protein UFOVP1096_3 [uncultured Caudovirales phage]